MQISEIFKLPDNINIEYLKDNITENQLLLLYWYIQNHENDFTNEQLAALYEFIYDIDNKLQENDENQTDAVHS